MKDDAPINLQQLRDLLEMLRRTVEAGAESARRIDILEKANRETLSVLVTLQENQQRLLEAFETQSNAQNNLNMDLAQAVQRLAAEIQQIKSGGLVM